jgi:hypothetical protein
MADKIIRLKIDVSKIDKTKLYKGEKGTYLSCTLLLNDAVDNYGNNGMIVQETTKEERDAGNKGAILGNCKVVIQAQSSAPVYAPKEDDFGF